MPKEETALEDVGSFERDTAETLSRLRSAFAELIAAVPGDISKAADLHRALRIDMKLSWKAFKVASAANPLAVGPHVPGPVNMRTFFKAAAKQGVPATLIEAASRAAADFDRLVATHAGDRASFTSMVSSLAASEDADQITLQHKRAAFRGNRHIWGVQAKTRLKCAVFQPADDPTMVDFAKIEGFISLRQLRREAPLTISRGHFVHDDGTVPQSTCEALDPAGEAVQGIALLREFCSKPLPKLRVIEDEAGFVYAELISNGVGNRGAITCIDGLVNHSVVPRCRDEHNRIGGHCVAVHIPCEVLIQDLLVREGTFGAITPVVAVYAEHLGELSPQRELRTRDLLPLHESIVYLGKGPSVLHTPDVPRYAEMARYAFDRLGWDGERFEVYRCRMEYPVMPSTVVVRFDLPEPPEV